MKLLNTAQIKKLINTLKLRFENNMHRHPELLWMTIQNMIELKPEILWSLNEMEQSGGEPDVVVFGDNSEEYFFCDCSQESPIGRRSVCYDSEALAARKENKPVNSAIGMAKAMNIEILNEDQYRKLQQLENFDLKTSSWIETPPSIRKLGGAIFADFRYGNVFIYHNSAHSYYSSRGFRALLKIYKY